MISTVLGIKVWHEDRSCSDCLNENKSNSEQMMR